MILNIEVASSLEFDGVLIKPRVSNVNSRKDVDISVNVCDKFTLRFPVIVSPMKGIVDGNYCKLISNLGGIGILHRFYNNMDSWYREVETASKSSLFGLSIGIDNEYYKDFLKYKPNILLVDVANGYTQNLRKFCSDVNEVIKDISPNTLLMAGNVATLDGVDSLVEVGVKMIRVGIGGGGLCSTRNVTGIGVSQLSAIMECSASGAFIVSDGGIKQSGDVVKALCAGADLAMAGSIFAKTFESPSDGVIFGMASRRLQEEMSMLQIKSVEGFEKAVQKELPLSQLVEEYSWGIKSAGTYLNARNIDEMRKNATFVLSGKGSVKQL